MVACVGGGSNAIGTFYAFLDDEGVELIGVEAGGEGLDSGRHGASLGAGSEGVLHGALSSILQDADGQILEAHSISAGLDYPGVGPEHAQLRDSGRVRYESVTDDQAIAAFRCSRGWRGSSRRSSPPTRSRGCRPSRRVGGREHLCASAGAATRTSPRSWRQGEWVRRRPRRHRGAIEQAFAGHGRSAALMPYMMGGFPTLAESLRVGEAYVGAART